jgi:catechol 2,3-dioxygenase-like lactoylglutathione lyase family enzyme
MVHERAATDAPRHTVVEGRLGGAGVAFLRDPDGNKIEAVIFSAD